MAKSGQESVLNTLGKTLCDRKVAIQTICYAYGAWVH